MKTEKDIFKTKVIFRVYKDGELIALFPELSYAETYYTTCYVPEEGHGDVDYSHIIGKTKLATQAQYENLFLKLESLGYNLEVVKKAKIKYFTYSERLYLNENITYHRNPTKYEIKFGEGAVHYKDFPRFMCIKANGDLKKRIIVNKLVYTL